MSAMTFDEALEAILEVEHSSSTSTLKTLGLAMYRVMALCPTDGAVWQIEPSTGEATSIVCPKCHVALAIDAIATIP